MSTITNERLRERAREKVKGLEYALKHPGAFADSRAELEEELELARIALASLEAEAVCVIDQSNLDYLKSGSDADVWPACRTEMGDVLLYRTAPPAPANAEPVAWLWSHRKHPSEVTLVRPEDDERAEGAHWSGWSCQALYAEPQAPVSVPDELPLDYLQGHKDGLEWAAQLAEANHPQTGDWLYDDPIDLAKAIRKGTDIPELKPVAADADDNFYSWFCREWEQNYQPNGYSLSAKKHLGAIAESAWFACRTAMLQGAENRKSRCTIQPAPALDSSQKNAESPSGNSPVIPDCSCGTCRPVTFTDSRFVVCSECGNKRCPHANDHRNACTGSNEPGQEGSAYPAAPQQEVESQIRKGKTVAMEEWELGARLTKHRFKP